MNFRWRLTFEHDKINTVTEYLTNKYGTDSDMYWSPAPIGPVSGTDATTQTLIEIFGHSGTFYISDEEDYTVLCLIGPYSRSEYPEDQEPL